MTGSGSGEHEQPLVDVSVIVPFRDAEAHLPGLLAALAGQATGRPFEVVWVDNGSRDGGPDLVRAALAEDKVVGRLVECEHPPSSYAARNVGVVRSRGRILAFTDADCRPEPGWLAAIVHRLDHPGARQVLAGAVELTIRDPHNRWEVFDHAVHLDNAAAARTGRVATANMAVRREVFAAVGPFPELTSGADHLWSRRARALGHEVVFAPEVVVTHPTRSSRSALVAKLVRTSRGQGEAAAQDRSLLVGNTLRALGRPFLLDRHLRVARSPEAADHLGFRVRLFLTSAWLRFRQLPAYVAGLRRPGGARATPPTTVDEASD